MSAAEGSYYRRNGVEVADVIEAFDPPRWTDQAIQYLLRAHIKKGGAHEAEDVAKAIAFLVRRLKKIEPEALDRFFAFGYRFQRIPDLPAAVEAARASEPGAPHLDDPDSWLDVSIFEALQAAGVDPLTGLTQINDARSPYPPVRNTDTVAFALSAIGQRGPVIDDLKRGARIAAAVAIGGEGDPS